MELSEIKNQTAISDVIGRHISLKKKGAEMVGNCPFHDDNKDSLSVNDSKEIFQCFACGTGGDHFDFFTKQGKTLSEAKALVLDELPNADLNPNKIKTKKRKAKPESKQATPTEKPAIPTHTKLGKPSASWDYHNEKGDFLGYILVPLSSSLSLTGMTLIPDSIRAEASLNTSVNVDSIV